MKDWVISVVLYILVVCFIPVFVTTLMSGGRSRDVSGEGEKVLIDYYGEVEEIGFEDYIIGVVAAEMPAQYELEALKAQAIAARTFTLKHLERGEAFVFTEEVQAFCSEEEMKRKWSLEDYSKYYEKIEKAVKETRGEVVLYNDELISAVFHSVSGGETRNANSIWGREIPYLIAKVSKWDEKADMFYNHYQFSWDQFDENIKAEFSDVEQVDHKESKVLIEERDEAGYVKTIRVNNKKMTGEEFRRILNLASANIEVFVKDDCIVIATKGYGHGVGLSQFGANQMALEGKGCNEILSYYYSDTIIEKTK